MMFLCVLLGFGTFFGRHLDDILRDRMSCIKFGTVVDIDKTHLSEQKIVNILVVFVTPRSVNVTDNSGLLITLMQKSIYNATNFITRLYCSRCYCN